MLKVGDLKPLDILLGPLLNDGWCRTGYYRVYIEDNCIILSDTYWHSKSISEGAIKVKSDDDLKEFRFVVNENDIELIAYDSKYVYDNENLFYLPLRRGGTSERHWYKLKNAIPNPKLQIECYKNEIQCNKGRIDCLLKENKELQKKIDVLLEKISN